MINTRCSGCQQKFTAPLKFAGKSIKCPKCNVPLRVPDPQRDMPAPSETTGPPDNPAPISQPSDGMARPATPVSSTPTPVAAVPATPVNPSPSNPTSALPPMAIPLQATPVAPTPVTSTPVTSTPGIPTAVPNPVVATPVTPDGMGPGTDDPAFLRTAHSSASSSRRKRKTPIALYIVILGALLAACVGLAAVIHSRQQIPDLLLSQIEHLQINEHQSVTIPLTVTGSSGDGLRYALHASPEGARINAATGVISWRPDESCGGASFRFIAVASDNEHGENKATTEFSVDVAEHNSRPTIEPVQPQTVNVGETLEVSLLVNDTDVPSQTFEFTFAVAPPEGVTLDKQAGVIRWTPDASFAHERLPIRVIAKEKINNGLIAQTLIVVSVKSVEPESDLTGTENIAKKTKRSESMKPQLDGFDGTEPPPPTNAPMKDKP